ncbi:unnamed protein product [Caenorhabditis sp. 36 PRJEB53466]|nr:unnamed protein product [Caenorhabditis sp. 36 PRJEB53466]
MTAEYSETNDSQAPLQKTGMLTPIWQMDVFLVEAIVLIPVYACILLDFVMSRRKHKCFQSPYYTLMVSQGLADISTVLIFSCLISGRYFRIGNYFLYNNQPYTIVFFCNSGPFMFTLRAVGVFLISGQRYLTVCKSHGYLNYKLNQTHPLLIGLLHWLIAFLIYLPALLNTDAYFENEITLLTIASQAHLQYTSLTVMTTFFVACVSIIFMYSQIAIVMVRARKVTDGYIVEQAVLSKRLQDARLTFSVFILVIFCFIAFFFYIGEYILAFDEDRTRVRAFRLYYPTVSGNLSFINPIMLLTMNRDVQSRLLCFSNCSSRSLPSSVATRNGKSTTGPTNR